MRPMPIQFACSSRKHHYTPGSGQQSLGLIFTLTTQDHFSALITCSSSTVIRSGWKLRKCPAPPLNRQYEFCNVSLLHMNYRIPLCRITVQHSLVKSSVCFCKANGIRHIRSAPRHPSMNGLAELAVQVFKSYVKKMDEKLPIELRITRFLARLSYYSIDYYWSYSC